MAYYAFLDENNVVTEVISGKDENEDGIDWEVFYGDFRGQRCKRTSYNTKAGKHDLGKEPFRKNYAAIGYFYDDKIDAFIPPKPFPSWTLDVETGQWQSPKPYPEDLGFYTWNEFKGDWVASQS